MRDPYSVLGVTKAASEKEIKSSFRKLAKKFHPDQNPDDPAAKHKFAEINRAYEIVGDKEKRAQFDRGEIDAEGKQKFAGFEGFPGGGGSPFGGFEFRTSGGRGGAGFGGAEDILKEFFGSTFGSSNGPAGVRAGRAGFGASGFGPDPRQQDSDVRLEAEVTVEDLARGKAKVTTPEGKTLSFSLPGGVADGQTIRLTGQGRKVPGAKAGDAMVTLRFKKHSKYTVDGDDLRLSCELPLLTAVLGGKLAVETLDGKISLAIPAWTSSGKTFRLKGKGLPRKSGGHGDLLLSVMITLPEDGREELEKLMRSYEIGAR